MPRIRRHNLPPALLQHLLDRIQQREIPAAQLGLLATWLDGNPEVPAGKWFKRFSSMTVCGEGELVKTFLTREQVPTGEEIPCVRRRGRRSCFSGKRSRSTLDI